MHGVAGAIDAKVRSLLAAEGLAATKADAARIVGEDANAWRAYVRGARSPRDAKIRDWLLAAGDAGVKLEVTLKMSGAMLAGVTIVVVAERPDVVTKWWRTESDDGSVVYEPWLGPLTGRRFTEAEALQAIADGADPEAVAQRMSSG